MAAKMSDWELARIREMYLDGESADTIGRELGRSCETVRRYLRGKSHGAEQLSFGKRDWSQLKRVNQHGGLVNSAELRVKRNAWMRRNRNALREEAAKRVVYMPSEEEIRRCCEEIKSGWSEETRKTRSIGNEGVVEWSVPRY